MQCAAALFLMYGLAVFAQDPSPSERAFREGENAFSERRLDDAARAYQELARLSSRTAEVHAKLGLIYYMQGRFSQAVPAFREAMRLKPGLPNVDVMLAVSLTELGQFAEALPVLERRFHHPP